MHSPNLPTTSDFEDDALAEELLATFPTLGDKIATALNYPPVETHHVLCEVLRFLLLSCEHGRPLTPSHVVDLAWHEWILFTRAYTEFCQTQFGRYIHHTPGGESEDNLNRYQLTLQLYETRFGPPNTTYWPPISSDCGACETLNPL
ncbi:MAG: hypothetical protein VX346_17525 [Planctomycetota bacterium]|nr:hypothetical protein [Planctomycetota bacterium]